MTRHQIAFLKILFGLFLTIAVSTSVALVHFISTNSKAANTQSADTITVMTYNLGSTDIPCRRCDSHYTDIVNYIAGVNPDIIMFQEIDILKEKDSNNSKDTDDEVALMNKKLASKGLIYNAEFNEEFEWTQGSLTQKIGKAVFSKYQMNDKATKAFTQDRQRTIFTFTISHPTLGIIRFFNHHPQSGSAGGCDGTKILRQYIDSFGQPSIAMGDFNLTVDDCFLSTYNIGTTFLDACDKNRFSWCTNSVNYYDFQQHTAGIIDHVIFHLQYFRAVNAYADQNMRFSDHLPLIAVISKAELCPKKIKGDADCNNSVNTLDFVCWRTEYVEKRIAGSCKNSDFDSSGEANILDFVKWKIGYVEENSL